MSATLLQGLSLLHQHMPGPGQADTVRGICNCRPQREAGWKKM